MFPKSFMCPSGKEATERFEKGRIIHKKTNLEGDGTNFLSHSKPTDQILTCQLSQLPTFSGFLTLVYTECICVPTLPQCVFTLDADAARLRFVTAPAISKYAGLLFLPYAGRKAHKFSAEQVVPDRKLGAHTKQASSLLHISMLREWYTSLSKEIASYKKCCHLSILLEIM